MPAVGNTGHKPISGAIIQVRVVASRLAQVAFNILHYRASGIITGGATNGELLTNLDTYMETEFKTLMAVLARYEGMDLKDITSVSDRAASINDNAAVGTGAAGDTLPMQTCGIITKYTIAAGPGFRGRLYLPFPSEGMNTAGNLPEAAYVTALNALALKIATARTVVGAAGTTTITPVIYHRDSGNADDVVDAKGRGYWGTQRRRGQLGQTNPLPF